MAATFHQPARHQPADPSPPSAPRWRASPVKVLIVVAVVVRVAVLALSQAAATVCSWRPQPDPR